MKYTNLKNIATLIVLFCIQYSLSITNAQDALQENFPKDTLIDSRDNKSYEVIIIDSVIWFNVNLAYKSPNSYAYFNDKTKSKTRYYPYLDSKSACPYGWRLPSMKEFDDLVDKLFKTTFTGLISLEHNWESINKHSGGFIFSSGGFFHKKKFKSTDSFDIWLADEANSEPYHIHMFDANIYDELDALTLYRHSHTKHKPKKNRKFAIRCVCKIND